MSKSCVAAAATMFALCGAVVTPVHAQKGLITQKALSLDLAMSIAQASLDRCRSQNFRCAVTVLGATGRTIIAFEDDGANLHRSDMAHRKAYTALVCRRPSGEVVEGWSKKAGEGIPLAEGTIPSPPVEGTIAMGGGLPIVVGNDVIGAIGVSGAPGWPKDEECAQAGIAKVADKLK